MFEGIVLNFWHWFALALILSISDLVLGAHLFLLLSGASAIIVGIALLFQPDLAVEYQALIFSLVSILTFIVWGYKLKTMKKEPITSTVNKRNSYYIGRTLVLTEAIVNGRGKVKVDDTVWTVTGDDLAKGARVKVVDADGLALVVESVTD